MFLNMPPQHDHFQSFLTALNCNNAPLAIEHLNASLKGGNKTRKVVEKLLKADVIFTEPFARLDPALFNVGDNYRLFFTIARQQAQRVDEAALFLKDYSKRQILQGAANYIEKWYAYLKYNVHWQEAYVNGDTAYLETERQSLYSTFTGIRLREVLKRYYTAAPCQHKIKIHWNLDTIECFIRLFNECSALSNLRDLLERNIHFNWWFEVIDETTLKVHQPPGKREGTLAVEIINNHKSKALFPAIERLALRNFLKRAAKDMAAPPPAGYWKYMPDKNNEEEMKNYCAAMLLHTDEIFEQELLLFRLNHFPLDKDAPNDVPTEHGNLPAEHIFRVAALLRAFSVSYSDAIRKELDNGVKHYGQQIPVSPENLLIDMFARRNKGNAEEIKKHILELDTEEARLNRDTVMWKAINSIGNEYCLVRQDYPMLVKTIQWLYQYEADEVDKIIDLFVCKDPATDNFTRKPFFSIDDTLCWLPNMVAHASFAENLAENIISAIGEEVHEERGKVFERMLNRLFNKAGYKTLIDEKYKNLPGEKKDKPLGDLDVLAWKDGHIIHLELKITNVRQEYAEREKWKQTKLKKAGVQCETVQEFICDNGDYIRTILGLEADAPIQTVTSFIISNSHAYDHEHIGGFLKISCQELICLLSGDEKGMYDLEDYLRIKLAAIIEAQRAPVPEPFRLWLQQNMPLTPAEAEQLIKYVDYHAEPLWIDGNCDPQRLIDHLEANRLFGHFDKLPYTVEDRRYKAGDYTIIQPGIVEKSLYLMNEN